MEIVFEHPQGFVNHGGNYVYLCLPWLGKAEWHAFSLYAHPTLENHSSVCVAKLGDWTGALHRAVPMPTAKPGWVYGPHPSPFSGATQAESMVCVASGIGITPTLGIVKLLAGSRKVNVVWMCRQADLISTSFARAVRRQSVDDHLHTGKRKLVLSEEPLSNPDFFSSGAGRIWERLSGYHARARRAATCPAPRSTRRARCTAKPSAAARLTSSKR